MQLIDSPQTLPLSLSASFSPRRRRHRPPAPHARGPRLPLPLRPTATTRCVPRRCALPACHCLHAHCLLIAACMRAAPPQLAAPAAGYAAAAAHALLHRCRRRPRAAAPPSRRMRSVQSLTGEEAWPVAVQYFESNISTFHTFNFNVSSIQFQYFYYQMLNQFNKMLN